jgi:hypothetical protein
MKVILLPFLTVICNLLFLQGCDTGFRELAIPARVASSETGSVFMERISGLPPAEREAEIFTALAAGNMPEFLRRLVTLSGEFADVNGAMHKVEYQVMSDYLAIGCDADFCRIPMSPNTAQRLANAFGASLITATISDHIYERATVKLAPVSYLPVGNANELVSKFVEHNRDIEGQLKENGGKYGELIAGIKKDVILSGRIASQPTKVVIYGWHRRGGEPIQPVYSGHVNWYVDYSHGIRLMNNQVLIDGKPHLVTEILKDPVLFRLFSNEDHQMKQPAYPL